MKEIFFMNSDEYITEDDRDLFLSIVGSSIEHLEEQIKKEQEQVKFLIYSNEKFIDNKRLNKLGLHIYRIMLANRIYQDRKEVQNDRAKQFCDQGYLLIEDFLPEEEFSAIKEIFESYVLPQHPNGVKKRINAREFFLRNRELYYLIMDCARVRSFSPDAPEGIPRTEFWNHFHEKNDPQYKFHTDTFQPTCKFWLYLEDIDVDQGPLTLIPRSHVCNRTRLSWDFENSLLARNSPLWSRRVEKNGRPGSFRILEGSSTEEEEIEVKRLGYNETKVMVGKKNTLLAANTFCFHKRGMGTINSHRRTLTMQYRPYAFGVY